MKYNLLTYEGTLWERQSVSHNEDAKLVNTAARLKIENKL